MRRIIHKCVTSRKLRGKFGDQRMPDLPKERCFEAALFTQCGADMFGHSPSERGGPILSENVPYSPVLQVEQCILR